MSTSTKSINESAVTLTYQLKGGLYPLTALQMLGADLSLFEIQLASKIQLAPKFFHRAPIVVDLQKLPQAEANLDFKKLMQILSQHNLCPVGIKGGNKEQQEAASLAGLPILQDNAKESAKSEEAQIVKKPVSDNPATNSNSSVSSSNAKENSADTEIRGSNTKIITKPVRSGQQIYVRGGDLIVLASVSHGSELLADGNIHVYGTLRGRALAGVTGDESAHIFCKSLEAELVSIAGQYKISEDIDQTMWRLAVNISMDKGHLHIRPL